MADQETSRTKREADLIRKAKWRFSVMLWASFIVSFIAVWGLQKLFFQ